jgi:hypothetical protein
VRRSVKRKVEKDELFLVPVLFVKDKPDFTGKATSAIIIKKAK